MHWSSNNFKVTRFESALRHGITPSLLWLALTVVLVWRAPGADYYYYDFDHGYPLAMGTQILLGQYPYIDFLSVYGPLTAWLSAATLSAGHLWAETMLCASLHALAMVLVFVMLRQHLSSLIALTIVISSIWLLGRFHKWFIWLFPITLLYCYNCYLLSKRKKYNWWLFAGIVAGVGALFRLEFGVAYLAVFAVIAVNEARESKSPLNILGQTYVKFLLGFLIVIALWLSILFYAGGSVAIYNYLVGTLIGGAGAVSDWSSSMPSFALSKPLSVNSAVASMFLLLPLSYLVCVIFAIKPNHKNTNQDVQKPFYLAVGIMGLAMYPHGFYRADVSHLHQTIACGLIGIPFAIKALYQVNMNKAIGLGLFSRGLAYLLLIGTLTWSGVLAYGPQLGWQPLFANSAARLKSLATLDPETSTTVPASLALEIKKRSLANEPILIVSILPQLYTFTHRRFSGLNPFYFKGIYDSDEWANKNLQKIIESPPRLVVVDIGFFNGTQQPTAYMPKVLEDFIRQNYQNVAFQNDFWAILTDAHNSTK